MSLLRIRLTGTDDDALAVSDLLNGLEGIEHVEDTDGLMPRMDDEDSSSAGLSDDLGPGLHELEVEVGNAATARTLQSALARLARERGVVIEYEDDGTAS
ncbi:hypothetical protein [Stenotrophomonas mori]|uniref:Uncharacterized protein n=1 Tax=Stenotrophomonas mori TaxID=2871096 RepID=A0ABT0SG66_9GAMM|nr:hypothetical protein [Stenotrophomonas mori]MCL7714315.1 hypothetical protein [Stenotrophomonas mori]